MSIIHRKQYLTPQGTYFLRNVIGNIVFHSLKFSLAKQNDYIFCNLFMEVFNVLIFFFFFQFACTICFIFALDSQLRLH